MSGAELERGFRPGRWLLGRGWWFLPLLLGTALGLPWIFGERWFSDASYYQAIATQMAREGTWWSQMQGDLPYFNKPPLAFWMHGVLVSMFGDADWAAHLPEGAAFLGVCLLTAWIARRLHGALIGVLAGCIMAITNDWIVRVGNFKLDALHTLWLMGAVACWVRACVPQHVEVSSPPAMRSGGTRWFVIAGVLMGAALMTKPFYGLGAAAIVLIWAMCTGLFTPRRALMICLSAGIGVMIATPWYAWMIAHHGKTFIQAHIHEQTVQRLLGEMHDAQHRDWYFKLIAGTISESIEPAKMWPVYAAAVVGLIVIAVRWNDRTLRIGALLPAIWLLAWFAALSLFGGKRNYYLMVLHPATAWLGAIAVAQVFAGLQRAIGPQAATRATRGAAVAGLIIAATALVRAPLVIARERGKLPVPERNEFLAFIKSQHAAGHAIYDCGLSYRISALAYIQAGFWPRCPSERTSFTPDAVPGGVLMAYKSDMLARKAYDTFVDPRDRLVFRSKPDGQYLVYERHAGAIPVLGPVPAAK